MYCGRRRTLKQFRMEVPPPEGRLLPRPCRCKQERLDREAEQQEACRHRQAVAGLKRRGFTDLVWKDKRLPRSTWAPDFAVPFTGRYESLYGVGPFDLENHCITEDMPAGCCLMCQPGKKYGMETLGINTMILLTSTMLKRDLAAGSK